MLTIMKKAPTLFLFLILSATVFAQRIDTLTFFSQSFKQERMVYVQTPEFYKYQSSLVQLPLIYVLDGQHEWLVDPILNTIRYLQYTHDIPQAIVVIIPLSNRNIECQFDRIDGDPSALHTFITEDLSPVLSAYNPGDYKTIIGHSFSASFALYSFLKAPDYYSAVIAHSPLDQLEDLISGLQGNEKIDLKKIFLSVGGIAMDKDYYHRYVYDRLKTKFPSFFNQVNTFEAEYSRHTAVPIVATPSFLAQLFEPFSSRYSNIAKVDDEYKLITTPTSVEDEVHTLNAASTIGLYPCCPEIPDLNGLASKYVQNGLNAYGIAVYEIGITYFPKYYEFHLSLYDLYLATDKGKAKYHLDTALELLQTLETDLPERQELMDAIQVEKKNNNW